MPLTPEEINRRKALSLGQAEGWDPMPRQLTHDEAPKKLRSQLIDLFDSIYDYHRNNRISGLGAPGFLFKYLWREFEERPQSELPNNHPEVIKWFRGRLSGGAPSQFYSFIHVAAGGLKEGSVVYTRYYGDAGEQYLGALKKMANILESNLAPFRAHTEGILYPAADEHTKEVIAAAIEATAQIGGGVKTHFREAARLLSNGEFAKSIKESWDSLESYVTQIGGEVASFDRSLKKIIDRRLVPNLIGQSWNKLLAYANDTPGIRHPLRKDEVANVTEADAIYMMSACGSAVSYLRSTLASERMPS